MICLYHESSAHQCKNHISNPQMYKLLSSIGNNLLKTAFSPLNTGAFSYFSGTFCNFDKPSRHIYRDPEMVTVSQKSSSTRNTRTSCSHHYYTLVPSQRSVPIPNRGSPGTDWAGISWSLMWLPRARASVYTRLQPCNGHGILLFPETDKWRLKICNKLNYWQNIS